MVMPLVALPAWRPNGSHVVLATQAAEPVLEQLDPPRRAAVIMAILALVLVGLLLVTIVMIGARWVRRMARHQPQGHRSSVHLATGMNREMREPLKDIVPDVKSDDTVQIRPGAGDTKMDH